MFGYETTRVWGRSAQQAEDCEAIPKNPADGWSSLLVPDSCWIFHGPRRLFAVPYKLNWRKLLVSVFKLVRPLGCKG